MKLFPPLVIALLAAAALPARSAVYAPAGNGCTSAIDFRLVGSWIAEGGLERKSFLPESRSQTAEGRPVSTETCMSDPDDVEELASVEIAPHLRSVTESHYHIGFVGLNRVLVTFPNGAMRFFRRIAAAPQRAFDAVARRRGP
ncbi:MAG: hypothetical protein NVSMB19_09950 [Vulcanimicrobiaceae bacterium]